MEKYIINKNKTNYIVSLMLFTLLLSLSYLFFNSIKTLIPIFILYVVYLLKNFFETKLIKVKRIDEVLIIEYKHLFKSKILKLKKGLFRNEFKSKKYYNGAELVNYWYLYIDKKRIAVFEIRKDDLEIGELKNIINFLST